MNIGYGGRCRKFIEDEEFIVYEYFCYDINENNLSFKEENFDGYITIKKYLLIKPDTKEKIKKTPKGRKVKVYKKILKDIPMENMINSGAVAIENCSHTWRIVGNGIDFIAIKLCRRIFQYYQYNANLPDKYEIFF